MNIFAENQTAIMYKRHITFTALAYSMFLLLGSLSWIACKKVENLLTFRIKNEASFMVPSAIGLNSPYSIPVPDVETNSSQTFENNNTNINKVKDIKLESLNLTISSPANATFKRGKINQYLYVSEGCQRN